MAGGTQDPGYASELVNRAGDATKQVAQWFEDREPAAVLHEIEDFARRRPGLFLAMAAGAGLLVGRFLRSAKDAPSDGSGQSGSGTSGSGSSGTSGYGTGYPATSGYESTGTGSTGTTNAGGQSGAYPAPATQNVPQDPAVPGSAGETPPAFPPPTADGTRPQTFGGDTDVRNT